jgi:ParB family chromosome partitioning protein
MLSLASMPEDVKKLCRLADIGSKSLLLQIVRQESPEKMVGFVEKISRDGLSRDQARQAASTPKKGRPKNFIFKYGAQGSPFRLQLSFRKVKVEKQEIIKALRRILEELESR